MSGQDKEKTIRAYGTVTVTEKGIVVEGFEFNNATCRDGAIAAAAWAIDQLQAEMLKTIERPGGGKICIG